jgi:hypothetical protein
MAEEGVNVINGSDPKPRSRSVSPTRSTAEDAPKEKRFLNGWSKEQEVLMAEWSDLAMCYRWLHDKSEKYYHSKTIWINLPVIILSTLGGTANFGVQSLFSDDTSKKYASFAIGGISLLAGLLTTIGNYLRYPQLEESHRVGAIAWGKFQRLIAVELALKPDDRIDSLDFLKICRADLDRLIEQSPPIPQETIDLFTELFGSITDLKRPDICGDLKHTQIFESSEARLKQVATEAALLLRHKKRALNELLSPQIQDTIRVQINTRLSEALEERKKALEEEIELHKAGILESEEEYKRVLESRQKRIMEEIDTEKKRLVPDTSFTSFTSLKPIGSAFENRLLFKNNPLFTHAPRSRRPSLNPLTGTSISIATNTNTASTTSNETTPSLVAISMEPQVNLVVIPRSDDSDTK